MFSLRKSIVNIWVASSKIRYLFVGLLNTGAAFLVYAVLVWLGLNFVIANFIALIFGILFSYQTIKRLVFSMKDKYTPLRYFILWIVLFCIQLAIIDTTIQIFGADNLWFGFIMPEHIGGAIGMANSVVIGYFLQKYWVFQDRLN